MISTTESTLRIALLAGGDSAEREISLRSGDAVEHALAAAGHRVIRIDPKCRDLADVDWSPFQVCFIALHGGAGEDGRVQHHLEQLGVLYTGSGPQASEWAMSKSASKRRFGAHGVPTLPYIRIAEGDSADEIAAIAAPLGYPLLVKPDNQGSSLGIAIADSPADLSQAISISMAFGGVGIAEPLVLGREFTVAVLEGRALPVIEIISPEGIFSYDAKYLNSRTEYQFEFALSTAKRAEISGTALAAANALGTCGLVRVDVMLDRDERVWVLEVNTIPGMTSKSLAPQAASRAGIDMVELCDLLARRCPVVAEVL